MVAPAPDRYTASADFHILVVDDHTETLLLLRHFLKDVGPVDTATSADEALYLSGENAYNALLVDINLGEHKTGTDLLNLLRQDPRYARIPIIACTAYALPGDRRRILEAGFDGYISKPFTKAQILQELSRHRQ